MSRQTRFPRCRILGLDIDAVTIAEAIMHVVGIAADPLSAPVYVVKPYVEFFPVARRTPAIMRILNAAELCVADGVAVQWAAAYLDGPARRRSLVRSLADIVLSPESLRDPIPERHGGANFTWPLLERCASMGLGVYLVGSPRSNSIEATASHLRAHIGGLRIVGQSPGTVHGPPDEAALARALQRARPDIVLVGMGFPLQEQLISRLIPDLDHGVLVGEGGTFDFREFGGPVRRAPRHLQRIGLEWIWRLGREPSRLRRQMAIPRFIAEVYRERRAATSR